ncbi:MAG: hypothetical protein QOF73_4605 [Thermomicrobiales bacterium]|nr:hypothetical protein [Thermomicrobiales bacterium]
MPVHRLSREGGRVIRKHRLEAGLSYQEFAERAASLAHAAD